MKNSKLIEIQVVKTETIPQVDINFHISKKLTTHIYKIIDSKYRMKINAINFYHSVGIKSMVYRYGI